MKMNFKRVLSVVLLSVMSLAISCGSQATIERESDFNFDWKFTLLEDTTTLTNLPLADNDWREVRLPHDWSVEHSFDENLEGCTGYLPGGVGVYQKHFTTTEDSAQKSTFILFDGVYNNAKFWLNGEYLGENPYGYSPVYFNLTDILNEVGQENTLTVYVDHSRYADSRWYTGSGIYRNVKLVTVNKLHIPIWGSFVTTPEISESEAKVNVEVTVENENAAESTFTLLTEIFDGAGKSVAKSEEQLTLAAGSNNKFNQAMSVSNPKLWDTENPNMYKAVTSVLAEGVTVDQYTVPFGIRSLKYDKDKGFFLNGKSTYVKGVCLHHDGGLVGAAVPEGVWRRRLELLKEGGCNAIRTSHNPFSEEFLNLCDEMGFLVQTEIFDEMDNPKDKRFNMTEREVLYRTRGYTEHFQEWGESDLKRIVMRDRNHPSIFQYSIGNEIEWTYPEYKHVSGFWDKGSKGYWNQIPKLTAAEMKERYDNLPPQKYVLAKTAKRLAGWVKDVDTTRAVTANLIIPTASSVSGYAAALDVVGVSYQIAQYDWLKKNFPDMIFTGNENSGYLSEWKSVTDNPMVFSMYMWTGIDYMGETNQRWPQKAWSGDMLDLAGFKKAGFNHFQMIWDETPRIALQTYCSNTDSLAGNKMKKLSTNWVNNRSEPLWNYEKGDMIAVEIVTNQPEATLYVNGKSLGSKKIADYEDAILRWRIPYEPGIIEAKTTVNGRELTDQLKTASKATTLVVNVDKTDLAADGYDVSHITVQMVDADGTPVRTADQRITFTMDGEARLLGVDNGWRKSTQDYQTDNVVTYMGRCMAIFQSYKGKKGNVDVTISADGIPSQTVTLRMK